ncbi:MAG: ABC transporter permease [Cytophagales bacterium]|nr:ABC transporter permease [Cytophagales bacterium]
MAINYFKIILRHLRRNKLFSVINILGLSIGLSITFYISLFLASELRYEDMHSKADSIYRVTMHIRDNNYDVHWARADRDWVKTLPTDIPEVKHLIRFQDYYPRFIQVGTDNYKISHAYSVDNEVFEVFDFRLLRGNPETALLHPYSTVLTQKMANTFFGDQDPMGKEISIIDATGSIQNVYTVTGVMEDLPANTHLPVNMLTSFASEQERTGWAYTYILSRENTDLASLESKLAAFIQRRAGEQDADTVKLPLQKIKSIHLNSDLAREIKLNGKKSHLWLVASVGLIVLIMSTINFINLNAAQSLQRLPEIGIRKVLGSDRGNLITYFFMESGIMCFISSVLAILFVVILVPLIQKFAPITVTPLSLIVMVVAATIVVAFIAGIFPAFVLTKQPAVASIKSKRNIGSTRKSMSSKNLLVALQIILCITLISCTLITKSQFRYLTGKKLGLDKEQLLAILDLPDPVKNKYDILKNQLEELAFVRGVTASMEVPSTEIRDSGPIYAEGIIYESPPVMDVQIVDEDFIGVMGLKLKAGRDFSEKNRDGGEKEDLMAYLQSQPREYIINETALGIIGWNSPEEALGKQFSWSIAGIQLQRGPVVGVVEDFHQESLKNSIQPLVMITEPVWIHNILVKLSGDDMLEQIAAIRNLWQENFPEFPMDYAFVDELYQKIYEAEERQLELIYFFSALAILIAFMGIFGLFAYTMRTREKELAIRKVLGASLSSITLLLSKHFLYLALVGICAALPLTWYVMEKWLENFVYHININWLDFLVAIGLIVVVLLFTISLQIKKINQSNPASILRSD